VVGANLRPVADGAEVRGDVLCGRAADATLFTEKGEAFTRLLVGEVAQVTAVAGAAHRRVPRISAG